MQVNLLTHTPYPEQLIATAARRCYSGKSVFEIEESLTPEKTAALIQDLFSKRHLSPFEHAVFTFEISGVSRSLSHQLVRHRIASYSQQSQRYVGEHDFNYVVPLEVSQNVEAAKVFYETIKTIKQGYKQLVDLGISKEDARSLLPNATETKLVMTMNARALIEFLRTRLCLRTQTEMRLMASQMLLKLKEVAPNIFEQVNSACIMDGICREKNKDCPKKKGSEDN